MLVLTNWHVVCHAADDDFNISVLNVNFEKAPKNS